MTDRLDDTMRFHQTALNARAYRQQVIASNIANADTPNFKARDVDFRAALAGALGGKTGDVTMKTTSARHIAGAVSGTFDASLKYRNEEQGAVDGNTVNMDVERAAFAENSVQYQASVTFINGLLTSMQRAVQGQ
ncbi:flagellar basal body rod protein FlgB [Zoogloea sp.]|uniref:flagellar basal body rod protein FlgB n=1 Tax=Zoogloea sp. TaxID=49181 RepID=UPI002603030E|nr:flagellar basal body rod protein FlgB [Zoogloea sp.]